MVKFETSVYHKKEGGESVVGCTVICYDEKSGGVIGRITVTPATEIDEIKKKFKIIETAFESVAWKDDLSDLEGRIENNYINDAKLTARLDGTSPEHEKEGGYTRIPVFETQKEETKNEIEKVNTRVGKVENKENVRLKLKYGRLPYDTLEESKMEGVKSPHIALTLKQHSFGVVLENYNPEKDKPNVRFLIPQRW